MVLKGAGEVEKNKIIEVHMQFMKVSSHKKTHLHGSFTCS